MFVELFLIAGDTPRQLRKRTETDTCDIDSGENSATCYLAKLEVIAMLRSEK
jgi:hypothetical protein